MSYQVFCNAEYIVKNGGLDTEKDYSYWSVGEMCNKNREGALPLLCFPFPLPDDTLPSCLSHSSTQKRPYHTCTCPMVEESAR